VTALSILLLGGSGFIGQAVVREFASQPAGTVRVRALLRRVQSLPAYPFLEKVEGSLEALPPDLEPAGPYVLVHLAVKQIDHDGSGYLATNVAATRALLQSLGPGLQGILYASSMSVYGQGEQDGISESAEPRPDTPLAQSRRLAEMEVESHARRVGVGALLLRPRFVIGHGDRFVLPALARMAARRVQIASGRQSFSVIDVDDYARVILRLAEYLRARYAQGHAIQEPLHVGYARPLRFAQIADALRGTGGVPARNVFRWNVPIFPSLVRQLRRLPARSASQLATRLELVGLSHWGNTAALASKIGDDIVQRDPVQVLERAVAAMNHEGRV
jgi:nucleoside-diphosphate-sugar epimerase